MVTWKSSKYVFSSAACTKDCRNPQFHWCTKGSWFVLEQSVNTHIDGRSAKPGRVRQTWDHYYYYVIIVSWLYFFEITFLWFYHPHKSWHKSRKNGNVVKNGPVNGKIRSAIHYVSKHQPQFGTCYLFSQWHTQLFFCFCGTALLTSSQSTEMSAEGTRWRRREMNSSVGTFVWMRTCLVSITANGMQWKTPAPGRAHQWCHCWLLSEVCLHLNIPCKWSCHLHEVRGTLKERRHDKS